MKKTTLTLATSLLLMISGLKAQSIQEGMNHLYAGRSKSAVIVFEKMLAVNPNNIEASYWLGQSLLESDEIMAARLASARQLYDKALKSSANAPLLLVGMGHVELLENKPNDARQRFEMALTMSRNNKKGDDPVIQTAIGRAIADSKVGDFPYAVQLLESATGKDPKNTETLLQLGNAYRKAGDGTGGGKAFQAYKKALEVNPSFAVASFRLAQIFASQKNWEPFLLYLNEAITKDPKFTLAYYELFYYSWFRMMDYPEAEKFLNKYIESKLPEKDVQDEYLYGQLCWGRKDFECAVNKAEAVVAAMGDKTKPKVYRLLADAYYQKGDFSNAKRNSDAFFVKKNPEDITLYDYQLRADILGKSGATDVEVLDTYMQGISIDTLVGLKIDLLKKGAAYFKEKKVWDKAALVIQKVIDLKPKPTTINDYFDLMQAYYKNDDFLKSRDLSLVMRDNFPDQVFGFDWAFKIAALVDTVKRDSIAVPDALKLFDFAQKDSVKFRGQYINSARFLAGFYINTAKDKEKSLLFFQRWRDIDTANAVKIQEYIEQIKKMPSGTAPKQTSTTPAKGTTPVKTGSKPAAKKPKTTTTSKAVVKN